MNGDAISGGMNEGAGVQAKNMDREGTMNPGGWDLNVIHHKYKTLTREELEQVNMVKNQVNVLYDILNGCKPGRDISIAKTKLEECAFWAVKGLTACLALLFIAGCVTDAQLSQDHVGRTVTSEVRSLFGTNMGFAKLQECEKKYLNTYHSVYEPVNCIDLTPWPAMWSQGQGGQLFGGVAAGAGAAAGGARVNTGSTVTNTAITSVTSGGKGHH